MQIYLKSFTFLLYLQEYLKVEHIDVVEEYNIYFSMHPYAVVMLGEQVHSRG